MPRKKRFYRRYPSRQFRRWRRKKTIPLLPLVGSAAGFFSPTVYGGNSPFQNLMAGNLYGTMHGVLCNYTGYNPDFGGSWDIMRAKQGLLPLVAGVLAHKALNMLGVNKHFERLPSPLNKIRL